LAIREIIGCINASGLTISVTAISAFGPTDGDLARMLILGENKVNTPKNKKDAPSPEPGIKRRRRTKDILIRLDDLIPEKDVKGGRQMPFGLTDTPQRENNPNK
jgi:hypothetical protein